MIISSRVVEATGIFLTLSIIAIANENSPTSWCSALALFLCFLHAQLAFELSERETPSNAGELPGRNQRLRQLYLLKEIMWVVTFLAIGNYPLVAGAIVFTTYPIWRGKLRIQLQPQINLWVRQRILAE